MSSNTHYRKVFDSPYLSSADVVDPIALTIARVTQEVDKTKKTKDVFNTAYFLEREIRPGEKLKPMILNATNSKEVAALTGSPYIEDWENVRVQVFVVKNIKFGRDTVDGLRIGVAPKAINNKIRDALLEELQTVSDTGMDALGAKWKAMTDAERRMIGAEALEVLKDRAAAVAEVVA